MALKGFMRLRLRLRLRLRKRYGHRLVAQEKNKTIK